MTDDLFDIPKTEPRELEIARREYDAACVALEKAESEIDDTGVAVANAEKTVRRAEARFRRAENAELRRWK